MFHTDWFGWYWLKLIVADPLYLALVVAVIIFAMLIMRSRKS
jgi:hypothetical protein